MGQGQALIPKVVDIDPLHPVGLGAIFAASQERARAAVRDTASLRDAAGGKKSARPSRPGARGVTGIR